MNLHKNQKKLRKNYNVPVRLGIFCPPYRKNKGEFSAKNTVCRSPRLHRRNTKRAVYFGIIKHIARRTKCRRKLLLKSGDIYVKIIMFARIHEYLRA